MEVTVMDYLQPSAALEAFANVECKDAPASDETNARPTARMGRKSRSRLSVDILSVATANPKYKIDQPATFEGAKAVFPQFARLDALYLNSGIETRYSCLTADWCLKPHSWEERTEV